jgi:hypothetical protein
MHRLVANQIAEALAEPARVDGLACERPLRVAAGTLSRAAAHEIGSTTVVGVLGADDVNAFEVLVAEIADEFGLDASIRLRIGSFSVRFSRQAPVLFDAPRRDGLASRLAQIIRGSRSGE